MTPKEAGALLAEPDWAMLFADRGGTELAFENILREWRSFHWTPVGDKKRPAGATEGILALALLGVMPPRSLPDRPPACSRSSMMRTHGLSAKVVHGELWGLRTAC